MRGVFSGAGTFDPFSPVSEGRLDDWYRKIGAKWPGERVCSKVRWRIYLRKRADVERYIGADEPRACRRAY